MDREIIREESEDPGRCITANKLLCKLGEESNYTGHVEDWNLHKQKVVLKVGTMIDKKTTRKANSNSQLANSQASKQRQPIEMDAKQKRNYALKNVEYDASSTTTTTSSSFRSSSSFDIATDDDDNDDLSSIGSHRSRSLNLPPFFHNEKSFRFEGTDGEFDFICRSLGLSGIDDFSIPTADWEAHRSKSDLATCLRHNLASSTSTPTPSWLKPAQPVKLDEVRVRVGSSSSSVFSEEEDKKQNEGKLGRSIGRWQKGELLGSGSFGTVYEGYTEDGFFFAVKEVSLLDQGSQGKQYISYLEQEISRLKQFEHENIVQYLGTDKDESRIYIFLELVTKGSLASLYQKYRLRDSQVSAYTRQILNGLKYLHKKNVIHRDIKCSNILVDASGSVKLADFGLAEVTKLIDIKSCIGNPFWMAPEVVNLRNGFYGFAADIWSLGCTVLEMLTRQHPYSHLEGVQALFRIGKGIPPLVPDSLSRDARDFILKCLQVSPNDRPTATQLLDHPFVTRPQNSFGPASPHNSIQL
nr:mitogen-activated protein kinase kinase kinase 1-like [Quercus suber]